MQEKWLILGKKPVGFLVSKRALLLSPALQLCGDLVNQYHAITVKTISLTASRGGKIGFESLQNPISEDWDCLSV